MPRLYNLDEDIGENENVALKHPQIVVRLQKLALKKNAEIGGTMPSARRPAGEVTNPKTLYPIVEEPKNTKKGNAGKKAG